jgi:hypothetical protein
VQLRQARQIRVIHRALRAQENYDNGLRILRLIERPNFAGGVFQPQLGHGAGFVGDTRLGKEAKTQDQERQALMHGGLKLQESFDESISYIPIPANWVSMIISSPQIQ